MRRLKLNESMVRRIEEALDERKYERRGPVGAPEYPGDRRAPAGGRRDGDRTPPTPPTDLAELGARGG